MLNTTAIEKRKSVLTKDGHFISGKNMGGYALLTPAASQHLELRGAGQMIQSLLGGFPYKGSLGRGRQGVLSLRILQWLSKGRGRFKGPGTGAELWRTTGS